MISTSNDHSGIIGSVARCAGALVGTAVVAGKRVADITGLHKKAHVRPSRRRPRISRHKPEDPPDSEAASPDPNIGEQDKPTGEVVTEKEG